MRKNRDAKEEFILAIRQLAKSGKAEVNSNDLEHIATWCHGAERSLAVRRAINFLQREGELIKTQRKIQGKKCKVRIYALL